MIEFLNWYSDGPGSLVGLVLVGLAVLTILVGGALKDRFLATLLPLALAFRFCAFAFTVFWLMPFYGDGSDALFYHNEGIEVAKLIRDGAWRSIDWGLSTKAMTILAGAMYTPLGADIYGGAFLSSILGLGGLIYMSRAFGLWVSPEQARTYSKLLLFMPSIAIWTGIFGKDSWMALGLGLAVYGYSAMQKFTVLRGLGYFIGGLTILTAIRPHIALAMAVAMTFSYILGAMTKLRGSLFGKITGVALLIGMIAVLYPVTMDFVGLQENASVDSVDELMMQNSASNAELGGSVVDVQVAPGVGGFLRALPRGIVRVLLEPFPWEITNPNNALAAAENMFLGAFILAHVMRPKLMFRQAAKSPYVLFSSFLAIALLIMMSLVPNLGLLSRQRVQLLPFLFSVLVAGEAVRPRSRNRNQFILRENAALTADHGLAATFTARPL